MRALRFWTTALFLFGLILLLGSPFLLMGRPPAAAPQRERLVFAATTVGYVILLLLVFFVVSVLAWRLVVRQREEYQTAHLQNLKDLVEGSLQDHQKQDSSLGDDA